MINLTLKLLINKLGNNHFVFMKYYFLIAKSELTLKKLMYNFIKILNTDRLEDKGKESCTCHIWDIK